MGNFTEAPGGRVWARPDYTHVYWSQSKFYGRSCHAVCNRQRTKVISAESDSHYR